MPSTKTDIPERITPSDLEQKFRALQGEARSTVDDKKPAIATIAGGAGIALLVLFFLLGRRAGKKKSAVIEIRRI